MSTSRPSDSPLGRVLPDDEGVRLEFLRTYDDPVPDVWSAITDSERLARWFGSWTGDPTTGEVLLTMVEAPDAAQPVRILECEPPHRLVVDLPSPDGLWRMVVTLREEGAGTVLVVEHRAVETDQVGSVGPGWHYYLDRLGAVVAGTPVPDVWDDYFPVLEPAYAPPG